MHRQMSFVDCSLVAHEALVPTFHDQYLNAGSQTHIVAGLWLPEANVLRSKADDIACLVNDTCSSTSCANVDANVMVHLHVHLIPVIDRILSSGRAHTTVRTRAKGKRRHIDLEVTGEV